MTYKLIKDVSTLTTIQETTLKRLSNKVQVCLCDYIEEALKDNIDEIEIDVEIGKLIIHLSQSTIKYRFVPNHNLSNAISDTIYGERSELVDILESSLVDKVENVYKSFF